MGWSNRSLARQTELIESAARLGLGSTDDVIDLFDERRKAIQRYQARLGIPKLGSFGAEKQLAQRHGRETEYWGFEYASAAVHGDEFATGRVHRSADGGFNLFVRDHEERWLTAIGTFALRSVLDAALAIRQILNAPASAAIDDLVDRLAEVVSQQPAAEPERR